MLEATARFVKTSRLPLAVVTGAAGTAQVLAPEAAAAEEPRRCTLSRLYVGGSIPCETARTLAPRLGLRLGQMGKLLDHLHIKVRHCGLGCFQ
jgi:hypothetical protein